MRFCHDQICCYVVCKHLPCGIGGRARMSRWGVLYANGEFNELVNMQLQISTTALDFVAACLRSVASDVPSDPTH